MILKTGIGQYESDKNKQNLFLIRIKEWYPFLCAFLFLCFYLLPKESMCTASSDAADIWETIRTFGSDNMYVSYVLYKGCLSVYPYLWLYRLALLLNTDEWLFVKLFYCFAYAYVTTIAFPNIYELLSGKKTVHYRKLVLAFLCFYFWKDNSALSQMMVDLPCLMYFLFLVYAVLSVYRYGMNTVRCLCIGLGIGLNLGGSGQYTVPAWCLCVVIILLVARQFYKKQIGKNQLKEAIKKAAAVIFPAAIIKGYNNYFLNVFVEGLRQKGAWIPTNMEWLSVGFSRHMNWYRYTGVKIPSNLNPAIFQKYLGDAFEQMREKIMGGGYEMTMMEYIKLVLHYPVSFCFCYLEKLFIILSPDGGYFRFLPLFIFYTSLFITIFLVVSNCKTWKDILNIKFWVIFAFFWAVVPMFIGSVEQRIVMQIQGLILTVALCDAYIWKEPVQWYHNFKSGIKQKFGDIQIPYVFFLYCLFIIFCFLHISSLYELTGSSADNIMIRFW